MSHQPTAEETAWWQRRLASQANNRAWALSEALSRTAAEDEEMLQAAHAAMHFWKIVGNASNRAHAALLVAHVYALLGSGDRARHYLAQSEAVVFGPAAEPWEVALAHAVAANVAAAAQDAYSHREHYANAVVLTEALTDIEDKKIVSATLHVVPLPQEEPA